MIIVLLNKRMTVKETFTHYTELTVGSKQTRGYLIEEVGKTETRKASMYRIFRFNKIEKKN